MLFVSFNRLSFFCRQKKERRLKETKSI